MHQPTAPFLERQGAKNAKKGENDGAGGATGKGRERRGIFLPWRFNHLRTP